MELILANANGTDERILDYEFDIEVGGENTFQLTVPYSMFQSDLTFKKRIYIFGTEYGGIINSISGDTSKDTIFLSGYTWRGILNKRYAAPGSFSGDLNSLIVTLIPDDGTFKPPSTSAGRSVSINITEYTPVEKIISDACMSAGYRLDISYVGDRVLLSAVPSTYITGEVSQDEPINFETEDNRMGINHLVCIGKNTTIHLFTDAWGNITQTQTYFGIDEYMGVYTSTTEDTSKLIEEGTAELKNRANTKSLTAALATSEDMKIGDFVTGRDYITGITLTKPVTKKIITYKDGDLTITNKIEGET